MVVAAAGTVDRAAEFTLADATLTVAAGAEQSSGTATITATPNDTDAPDQVVTVSGTASNSQGIDGDPEAVELTIADDDAAPTVTLALAMNPIAEENGSTAVTASLSHPSSEATTVTVTAAAVAPTVPGDFAQSGSVLTIAAGDLESTGTVTVTAAPNFVDAADKTVRVSATAANTQGKAGDPANVNLTIADDDERGFTWSPQTMNIEEAAAFRNYMVALTSEPTADMTVTIADPGGDLRFFDPVNLVGGTSMTLTFTPDNWSTAQEVGVSAIPDSDSRNEQIDLRHTGAGGDYQGYRDTYRVVVSDDDRTARKVILTVDPTGVEEGGGARQVTVTATLDGARRAEATAVTVTAGPGSADATDFTATPASFHADDSGRRHEPERVGAAHGDAHPGERRHRRGRRDGAVLGNDDGDGRELDDGADGGPGGRDDRGRRHARRDGLDGGGLPRRGRQRALHGGAGFGADRSGYGDARRDGG